MPVEPDAPAGTVPNVPDAPAYPWYQKLARVTAAALCMGLGLFLVVAPWTDTWHDSYLPALGLQWRSLWMNSYFRGAVSGLGVLDVYIAVQEIFGINVPRTSRQSSGAKATISRQPGA